MDRANAKSHQKTKRQFLKTSSLAASAVLFIPASALGQGSSIAPSDRIMIGAIGTGGRFMRALLPNFYHQDDVRLVAVSDCWQERRAKAKAEIDKRYGNDDCTAHRYHEDVLERDDIDAVIIATGDRWHGVMSSYAARAGKDIYSEKPYCLTIGEGRQVVDITKKYGTVWQCGTQRHSNPDYLYVIDCVHQGKIGKLHTIHINLGPGRHKPGFAVPAPVPDGFDYDRWLGQSPWRPYSEFSVRHWRNHWDTSGGQLSDMGPHMYDLAQMGNQSERIGPVEIAGTATFPQEGFDCVPYEWDIEAKYENGVRMLSKVGTKKIRFIGDEGWIEIMDETGEIQSNPKSLSERSNPVSQHYNNLDPHIRNFLDCIRTREQTVCNPEIAQRSHTIAHASNICLRLGRKLQWNYKKEMFIDDDDANRMISKTMRIPWTI